MQPLLLSENQEQIRGAPRICPKPVSRNRWLKARRNRVDISCTSLGSWGGAERGEELVNPQLGRN